MKFTCLFDRGIKAGKYARMDGHLYIGLQQNMRLSLLCLECQKIWRFVLFIVMMGRRMSDSARQTSYFLDGVFLKPLCLEREKINNICNIFGFLVEPSSPLPSYTLLSVTPSRAALSEQGNGHEFPAKPRRHQHHYFFRSMTLNPRDRCLRPP